MQKITSRDELAERYDLLSLYAKEIPNISMKELRDNAINFIIAGRDTTAILLTWTCYELCMNPEVQDRVFEEVMSVCSKEDGELLTYEKVQQLKYLEAVLLESLRLHPSVPTLIRFALEDIECPHGEIIRKGDGVIIFCYGLSRMPKLWKDPLQFNPSRFYNQEKGYEPSYYPYFNILPRLCLGKHVALMEAKIAIAKILMKYQLQLKKGQTFNPVFSATLQLEKGMDIFFIPRK
ncbi:hypothetical protein RFI_21503 [Reticulomyxa filosa]|uniref:Cytochrome P450 n=1 Tax=Reticulomyxa filosa TaxID=46433 RepID=X6MQF8_RETFI|nr:hypothetical protein RFI_21503 [Reticulomyxa filosa]|eukprot:ETO15861.1 hypothetical protein RFI_21503 [Reticulomyxa filosa]